MKFNFPMASAVTLLAWGGLEYGAVYKNIGQWGWLLANIQWVTDYFIKCHTAPNEFYGQIGIGMTDHKWWGAPEVMPFERPAFKIDAAHPGSELAAEAAAALAVWNRPVLTEPVYAPSGWDEMIFKGAVPGAVRFGPGRHSGKPPYALKQTGTIIAVTAFDELRVKLFRPDGRVLGTLDIPEGAVASINKSAYAPGVMLLQMNSRTGHCETTLIH